MNIGNVNYLERLLKDTRLDTGRVLNVLSVILGLVAWELWATNVPATLIPRPSGVVSSWITYMSNGTLPNAFANSLVHMFSGYAIAAVTAIPLGFAMGRSKIVRWAVNPYIDAIYSTPAVAYIPLIIVWFGLQLRARIFMVFIFCFFEMLISTQQGISSINPEFEDVAKSFDLSWWERQQSVLLPASLPFIFSGLRIGMGRAVRGMIVAELFLAIVNLGSLLTSSTAAFDTSIQLAIILTISFFGLFAQMGVKEVEKRVIPWHFTREVE